MNTVIRFKGVGAGVNRGNNGSIFLTAFGVKNV